jgi:hypothetical protein
MHEIYGISFFLIIVLFLKEKKIHNKYQGFSPPLLREFIFVQKERERKI